MLKRLTCDRASFKTVEFRDGLNLIVADKTAGSAQKGTRNGSGKTTLVEIIHHCLGARRSTGVSTLAHEAMQGWKFSLTLVAAGRTLTASRTVGSDDVIVTGDTIDLPVGEDGVTDREKWTEILSRLMFGVQAVELQQGRTPKFRQLIRYFARLGPDAMSNAFETVRKQSLHEVRVLTAFLLQLDWELALKMKELSEQHAQLGEAKRAVESGAFDLEEDASTAKLQATETALESEIEQATSELQTFRVHRQYSEIESEASRLTSMIQEFSQHNYGDRQLLEHYLQQQESEVTPDIDLLIELYRDAGVVLGQSVKHTLDQAKEFHRAIVGDRRRFLEAERLRIEREIKERSSKINVLSDRRAECLEILRTHGALSEFEKLSERVDGLRRRLAEVSRRRMLHLDLDQKRLRLNVALAELRLQTQQQVANETQHINSVQKVFVGFSRHLYGKVQHVLEVNAGTNGYVFKVDAMDRGASEGIAHAGIFCYDATLATIWAKGDHHPGFLIHDSSLFDPIEERQIEQALATMSDSTTPFQYICTLNSDRLPQAFPADSEFVILRLTDRGQSGGLLGVRF